MKRKSLSVLGGDRAEARVGRAEVHSEAGVQPTLCLAPTGNQLPRLADPRQEPTQTARRGGQPDPAYPFPDFCHV